MGFSVRDRDLGYSALVKTLRELSGIEGPDVLVGVRAASAGADQVIIAASNEFGTNTSPERSYLRSTVEENRNRYLDELEQAVIDLISGFSTRGRIRLKRLGLRAVEDVQRKIVDLKVPPNAPSTIAAKGSTNPLIDTGRMRQSIDSVVTIDGEEV